MFRANHLVGLDHADFDKLLFSVNGDLVQTPFNRRPDILQPRQFRFTFGHCLLCRWSMFHNVNTDSVGVCHGEMPVSPGLIT